MAHYNLCETLGIDRSASTHSIAEDIDARLSSGNISNPGGADELQVARQIIGDQTKRGMYDARLDDPNAPDIDIAALRDLVGFFPKPGEITHSNSVARMLLLASSEKVQEAMKHYQDFYFVSVEDGGKQRGVLTFGVDNDGPAFLGLDVMSK